MSVPQNKVDKSKTLLKGDTFVQEDQTGPNNDVFVLREYVFKSHSQQDMKPQHWITSDVTVDLQEQQ